MDGAKQIGIKWRELPCERRRRLTVQIGRLVRQHLATTEPEACHERNVGCRSLPPWPLGDWGSLQAAEDIEAGRTERQRHWAQRLERARHGTMLARRRYGAVEAQNRLVARTLEWDWKAALGFEQ